MQYDHAVKFDSKYYKSGEDVPIVETVEAEPDDGHEADVKKPGRPKKAAGQ